MVPPHLHAEALCSPAVSLVDNILQRMGVAPAERGLFGWAGLCLFLMGAAAFALMNTAETLFLKRVGVEALPLALLMSSGLLVLTTGLVGRFASGAPSRALPWLLAVLAVAPLPFIPLAETRDPLVFGAFVLVARQILALGMLAFWLAMGSLVPGRGRHAGWHCRQLWVRSRCESGRRGRIDRALRRLTCRIGGGGPSPPT